MEYHLRERKIVINVYFAEKYMLHYDLYNNDPKKEQYKPGTIFAIIIAKIMQVVIPMVPSNVASVRYLVPNKTF